MKIGYAVFNSVFHKKTDILNFSFATRQVLYLHKSDIQPLFKEISVQQDSENFHQQVRIPFRSPQRNSRQGVGQRKPFGRRTAARSAGVWVQVYVGRK